MRTVRESRGSMLTRNIGAQCRSRSENRAGTLNDEIRESDNGKVLGTS